MSTSHEKNRSAIIISASSDIGTAIAQRWSARGWTVFGTYRTGSQAVEKLRSSGIRLIPCDLSDSASIGRVCSELSMLCRQWDILAMCPGALDPIGAFIQCSFDEWEDSVRINFTGQMHIVHELLPSRRVNSVFGPCVLFFAGGGTNNAPVNYSAYIVSKIALIKMCELLDAEISDTRFVIIGTGWVTTRIHEATLRAEARAGPHNQITINKLASNECIPMETVLDCCDWAVNAPRELVSGRNFSVAFDMWGTKELEKKLAQEADMYKLRRHGNDWLAKNGLHPWRG